MNIERALMAHFDPYRNLMLFEAPVRSAAKQVLNPWGNHWEQSCEYFADLLVITPHGYATEVEIKVSRADWRADLAKEKWAFGLPTWISRFIYAVPASLGIPEWVPPKCGVLHFDNRTLRVARAPGRIGKEKVPDKVRAYLLHRTYIRYWTQQFERVAKREDSQLRYRVKAEALAEAGVVPGSHAEPGELEVL
jgi:hypothetical protein